VRRRTLGQRLEHAREEVVRAGVVEVVVPRADDVEVPERGVRQRGDAADVAQQPLADELALAVRRLRQRGGGLGDDVDVRRPEDAGAGREHDLVDARLEHPLDEDLGADDVLPVGVQRAADGLPGVLVAGAVDDAGHRSAVRPGAQGRVHVRRRHDRALHQADPAADEPAVAAGEVVQHGDLPPGGHEVTDDVGADVAGASGDKPGHDP
jgi:hypothetical protein